MSQRIIVVLATLAVITITTTSALKVGPLRLPNNNRFINYTEGASPSNSVLECVHELEGDEELAEVSFVLWNGEEKKAVYKYGTDGGASVSGVLDGYVVLGREGGALELTELKYEFRGEYSCNVTLTTGETQGTARWELVIVDSLSHMSTLHRTISGCSYITSYSTLPVFPEPVVRAGLYSENLGGFYKEVPKSLWLAETHKNGSVTNSYSDIKFELNADTPIDISFIVTVAVIKKDGNYIPISSAEDKHIILHHLGCPEPRLEAYQHIEYHRDTITCRGEHKEAEATVTCKEGYHADSEVEAVPIKCDDPTRTWVLTDGTPARREHLMCVINDSSATCTTSLALLLAAALLHRFIN